MAAMDGLEREVTGFPGGSAIAFKRSGRLEGLHGSPLQDLRFMRYMAEGNPAHTLRA
jgi:hypothetical protein